MTDVGLHGWEARAPGALPADGCWDAVASSLGISNHRLAEFVRAGLIDCSDGSTGDGEIEIRLTDAAAVRSLCDRPAGRANKLRSTLDRVRAWMPTTPEPIRRLTLVHRDGPLLVRLPGGNLADPAGQFRFDFQLLADHGPIGMIGLSVPNTARDWHEHGIVQESAGDLSGAAESYGKALLVDGPDPQIVFDLAYCLAESGQTGSAIERYRQVIELDPLRQDAWVNLGDLLVGNGRTEDGISALRKAIDLDPDDAAAHYNLADALETAGDEALARLHFKAFIRLSSEPGPQLDFARSRVSGVVW